MFTLIKAAGVDVEPVWTTLFARALEGLPTSNPIVIIIWLCIYLGKDVGSLICNVGSGVAATGGGGGGAAAADAVQVADAMEEKKEEKKQESDESDDDMGFGEMLWMLVCVLN